MNIEYDKDFEKVINELQTNFEWINIEILPDSYKDLLNDTIKAVKNCNTPDVIKSVCEHCRWKNNRHTEPCNQCSNNYGLLFEQTVL